MGKAFLLTPPFWLLMLNTIEHTDKLFTQLYVYFNYFQWSYVVNYDTLTDIDTIVGLLEIQFYNIVSRLYSNFPIEFYSYYLHLNLKEFVFDRVYPYNFNLVILFILLQL